MTEIALRAFPAGISADTLTQLLDDTRNRETLLQSIIHRFEQRYGVSLETLEARLARGEGSEHPDWRAAKAASIPIGKIRLSGVTPSRHCN